MGPAGVHRLLRSGAKASGFAGGTKGDRGPARGVATALRLVRQNGHCRLNKPMLPNWWGGPPGPAFRSPNQALVSPPQGDESVIPSWDPGPGQGSKISPRRDVAAELPVRWLFCPRIGNFLATSQKRFPTRPFGDRCPSARRFARTEPHSGKKTLWAQPKAHVRQAGIQRKGWSPDRQRVLRSEE